ncbi:ABC transporter permease [Tautonia plasticadhaerens]|uniref:D-allose transport system permease protein AlsC n=1 Tax=Tautonia plasticadhaerens TaxID=2527974 RepID=A0A518H1K5_9BACT|nr:ABC transporter permease [Tautonia plasticadhaerens]QDV34719.1 D-allose transport system permease protein AlsC [Tautonia plasticadhaerens]
MTGRARSGAAVALLRAAPALLFLAAVAGFGLATPRFLTAENAVNVLVQSSATAIVAAGMTFVLITAGIDLSVGSIMFLGAIAAGKLALAGGSPWLAAAVAPAVGLGFGLVNAALITRLRLMPFIVTLATLSIGRGLGLFLTQTRAMNLPGEFLRLGSSRVLGIVPLPVAMMVVVLSAAQVVLSMTPIGRQLYAVGNDPEAAKKAGIRVGRVLAFAYLASGLCASIGGLVLLGQLAAVSPSLGDRWEFEAIAAAVLGGSSLFGGKGRVLPGTLFGAVLIQAIRNGLNVVNADPYLYPVVTGVLIFLAVALDGLRHRRLALLRRPRIRPEAGRSPR